MAETIPTATKKVVNGKKYIKAPEKKEGVTVEQFAQLVSVVSNLAESIRTLGQITTATPATPAETKQAKAVAEAVSDQAPLNPQWDAKAKEIIGEAVDHCEVFYPKKGGTIFTIVIKKEFSNAPADYLIRMGSDRRSRELGNEGIEGVELWSKLVRDNLKRPVNR